jgi:hypothetical protein
VDQYFLAPCDGSGRRNARIVRFFFLYLTLQASGLVMAKVIFLKGRVIVMIL